MAEWITEINTGETQIEHLDGISWREAPMPPWLHRCKPQTRGWTGYFTQVYRCACGGFAFAEHKPIWLEKNSRRKSQYKRGVS